MVSRRIYFSVINNAVYIAFGPILTVLGAYMMSFYKKFQPLVDELTWTMPMVFMVLGICTILVAIFACLQLATEFLVTAVCYFIVIVILILLLIGAGAFWVNVSPSYPSFVNDTFDKAYASYEDYQLHQAWTVLQTELQCCGLNGMSDFESIHTDIPIDCCRNKTVQMCSPDDMILDGCLHAFLYRVYLDRYLLGTVAILAGSMMLLMLVSSVFVCFDDDESDMVGGAGGVYCMEDDGDDQYYTHVVMVDQEEQRHEKHPAFAGRDLTYVPDQAPQVVTLVNPPPQPQQQQTIIVQPGQSVVEAPQVVVAPQPTTVVVEEMNAMPPPPAGPAPQMASNRLVRVVRKLPMLESGGSRMRYCASPATSNCRRCSHVSKCKRRRGVSLLDTGVPRSVSRTSLQSRRLSNSPEHVIMEAPKANSRFYCRKVDGRTVCRATPI